MSALDEINTSREVRPYTGCRVWQPGCRDMTPPGGAALRLDSGPARQVFRRLTDQMLERLDVTVGRPDAGGVVVARGGDQGRGPSAIDAEVT